MIVAGKTRSGKTYGILSILMPVLLHGADRHGSKIVVIDPKTAELSRCGAISPGNSGDMSPIIKALEEFNELRCDRQSYLNDVADREGDAVRWWDAGLKPSFIVIDEYVALRSMLPKRATKGDCGINQEKFDALLRQIVTMGASAGCFAIISIAQASVGSGGLPSMLLDAMGTKILFRPTLSEGLYLWTKEELSAMSNRHTVAGEAWISSDDGEHASVTRVRFPSMEFPAYSAFRNLLGCYNEMRHSLGGEAVAGKADAETPVVTKTIT